MKIQRRLTLGIGILFAMIVLLGIQSVSYVRQLSRATGTILAPASSFIGRQMK